MVAESEIPQRIARLTPLADVLGLIEANVAPVAARDSEIGAASGHVLAEDVRAADARPRAATALRDGWAVDSELTRDAGSYAPAPLPNAIRVEAGMPLPPGSDAIAPLDLVVVRGGRAEIVAAVGPGEGVLSAGADADRGRSLLTKGLRLSRTHAAVLAAAGIERAVIRAPRVRVVSSQPASDPILDAIVDLLGRAIETEGGLPTRHEEETTAAMPLEYALKRDTADAIIAIGGTGTGRNDASVRTLARIGRVEVHGIALAPGETAAFGFVGPRPVLLLPGRMDAALAVWLMVGRCLLARLSGSTGEDPATSATLARKVTSPLGLTEVVPVRCRGGKAEPIASGYWPLRAIAQADGWIVIAADSEGLPAGAEVVVRPWP